MDELSAQLNSLEPQKLEEKIIRQVAEQLSKDFSDFKFKLRFKGSADPYTELKALILPIVAMLLEKHPARLFALFYRIDISENDVRRHFGKPGAAEAYTDLILDRELKKVIIRNFYSGKI